MALKDEIRPITELKSHTAQLVREVERDRRPLLITQNGRACAVLLDVETWDRLRQSIAMLRIVARAEADFEAGRVFSTDEVFASARAAAGNAQKTKPKRRGRRRPR